MNSLEIKPKVQLLQEKCDCCPICLEEINELDEGTFCFFVCCGKIICKQCALPLTGGLIKSCPFCRHRIYPNNFDLKLVETVRKNAMNGQAWAQFGLAVYIDAGYPWRSDPLIKRDDSEAFRLYLLSANQGFLKAQLKVGESYFFGSGVEKSIKEASYWFTLASNQGSASAQNYLGKIIRDREKSIVPNVIALFRNSAEQGLADAQYNLAFSFIHQKNPDYQQALCWFKKLLFKIT